MQLMENFILNELNDDQRKAVEYCDGPQLVIAGAGSGKTRVLTYKIAYLLERGMKPWNVLALTFTNKAANEMKQRIGQLVGQDNAYRLNMGTFHAVFARILRVEAELLGFNSNFTIYDEADSRSLLKSIINDLNLNDNLYMPATVHHFISMAKNNMISVTEYIEQNREDLVSVAPEFERIHGIYERRCILANAMDFDDLLCKTYLLLANNEEIRHKYGSRFEYILIDEYQDTNTLQKKIVQLLAKEHNRVCAVGDDAQSIYSFRGANIDNILNFDEDFEDAFTFLVLNYRSTKNIVNAANSLIKHNKNQINNKPNIETDNEEGEKLILKHAYSDKEEASIVCNDIKRIRRNDKCEYSDFAILYRTNAQSRPFEEEMRRQNIPYRIYGGLSFYQRKEIKDIIAYFRFVVNPNDEEAFKRIINYPARGIGNTTVQKIATAAQTNGVSYWEVIKNPVAHQLAVNGGTMKKIDDFKAMMGGFIGKMTTTDAYELGQEIIRTSGIFEDLFSGKDPEQLSRQQNLEEFLNGLQDFVNTQREEGREQEVLLPDFLQEVSLLTDLDSDDNNESRVLLMTIHAAKGLEFPTVFVVGMEENIFPSPLSSRSLRELEEERRLLYVAITRAEQHCILTCAKSRWRYGKMEFGQPSRFLKDIDPRYITVEGGGMGETTGYGLGRGSSMRNIQNSRPVASQFMADQQAKITAPRRPERPVDPFSDDFKRKLASASGKFRKLDTISRPNTLNQPSTLKSPETPSDSPLKPGNVIEHQRFGIGTVVTVEGSGENTKATVDFRNVGTKQLLLKFARYTVIKS